jgi:hypothetical protein
VRHTKTNALKIRKPDQSYTRIQYGMGWREECLDNPEDVGRNIPLSACYLEKGT